MRELQCEYTRRICEEKFPIHKNILAHIRHVHKDISVRDYQAKYGHCRNKTVKHSCRICNRMVLHTKDAISSHVWNFHLCMSATEYKEKYLTVEEGGSDTIVLTVPWELLEGTDNDEEVSESSQVEDT